jgi:hypothetical protein
VDSIICGLAKKCARRDQQPATYLRQIGWHQRYPYQPAGIFLEGGVQTVGHVGTPTRPMLVKREIEVHDIGYTPNAGILAKFSITNGSP